MSAPLSSYAARVPGKYSWIALGAGAYLAFLLTTFPAATAYRWFAPDAVRLAGVEGTLWSGSATLGSVGDIGLHEIQWRLRPWALFLARVGGQFQTRFGDGLLSTDVEVTLTQTTLRNFRASASLGGLRELLPLGGIEGFVSADFAELRIQDAWPVGATGELRLGELVVPPLLSPTGGALIALGNYQIRFAASTNPGLVGNFEDQGGPLEVSGSIRLTPDRAYVIDGALRTRPNAPLELSQGLELMTAPPDASGLRAFNLTGSL